MSSSVSIGSSTISTDDLDFRMIEKPLLDTLGFAIWKQVKHAVSLKVNDDRSIAFSSFPGEIIDSHYPHVPYRWIGEEKQRMEKRHSREMNPQLRS